MTDFVGIRVTGIKETLDYFKLLAEDKFPVALAKACNDTAFLIRDAEMQTMREVFKKPKEQTIRNIRVFKGNKSRPGATVAFSQIYDGEEYMVAEVEGGQRAMKRSEKAFGHFYVPGIGAQLDDYGNMKPSQIVQIMSYFRLMVENGYSANRRNKIQKSGVQYFKLDVKTHNLAAGIYMRVDKSMGQMVVAKALSEKHKGKTRAQIKAEFRKALNRGVIPVIIFVSHAPDYKAIFPFFEVAARVTSDNWTQVMGDAVDQVLTGLR